MFISRSTKLVMQINFVEKNHAWEANSCVCSQQHSRF